MNYKNDFDRVADKYAAMEKLTRNNEQILSDFSRLNGDYQKRLTQQSQLLR